MKEKSMDTKDYILIVTGSRSAGAQPVHEGLNNIVKRKGTKPFLLIHGGAQGADAHADSWAKRNGVNVARIDALWDAEGRSAGPKRNQRMLDYAIALAGGLGETIGRPIFLRGVAFPGPGSRGTWHMVKLLRDARIATLVKQVAS